MALSLCGHWRAALRVDLHPHGFCLLRVPFPCQPWCAHAGDALPLCVHGNVRRIHLRPVLPHVQGHQMEKQCHLDRNVVPGCLLWHLLRLELVHLGPEVLRSRSVRNSLRSFTDVARNLYSSCACRGILRISEAAHREPSANKSDPTSGARATMVRQRLGFCVGRWGAPIWSGICRGVLCSLLDLESPILLPVRFYPPCALHVVADGFRGHYRSLLLPVVL
mmetsp:Transcript_22864/g.35791  ORF Transcript_22864/g.35791 Transcript_22864/m.35791 type:complete len:221 (-) Transcript_22864:315-977(-)